MKTRSKNVVIVLGALAAGVVIGLLVAPQKGKKLRKRLKKTAGKWTDTVNDLFTQSKDGVEETTANTNRNKEMPTAGL